MLVKTPIAAAFIAGLALCPLSSQAGAPKPARRGGLSAKAKAIAKADRAAISAMPVATTKELVAGPSRLRGRARTRFAGTTRGSTRVPARRVDPTGAKKSPIASVTYLDITGWTPEHGGAPGDTLTLLGYGLPVDGLEVYIGTSKLTQQPSSSTQLKFELPSSAQTGELKVKRLSDGAVKTLQEGYVVASDPPPPVFSHFDADASGHHAVDAYLLALLSWYAYDDVVGAFGNPTAWENNVDDLLDGHGLPNVDCFDVSNATMSTQGCVAGNDAIVVVFLRGTQTNPQDWGADFTAVPIPVASWGKGVMIHPGFSAALASAWPDINTKVAAYRNNGQKVWMTGHSLGGALATLAAMRMEKETSIPVHGVYTYGAPGVGNDAFKAAYEATGVNHQRYTNAKDIVPALPPSVAGPGGYAHVGNLVGISTGGTIDPGSTAEPALTPDKHFEPYHYEYPKDLRAAVTPASLRNAMPAVPAVL